MTMNMQPHNTKNGGVELLANPPDTPKVQKIAKATNGMPTQERFHRLLAYPQGAGLADQRTFEPMVSLSTSRESNGGGESMYRPNEKEISNGGRSRALLLFHTS